MAITAKANVRLDVGGANHFFDSMVAPGTGEVALTSKKEAMLTQASGKVFCAGTSKRGSLVVDEVQFIIEKE